MPIPLTFGDLARAIASLTAARAQINRVNMWRQLQETKTEPLGDIDPELAQDLRPYAPSKGVGNPKSLWSKFHFGIMIPNFQRMKSFASHAAFADWHLSDKEASRYFRFTKDLKRHVKSYRDIASAIDDVIKHLPAREEQLAVVIQNAAKLPHLQGTETAAFFGELPYHLSAKPVALFDALQELRLQSPAKRRYRIFFSSAFESLPELPQLGLVFSGLLHGARRQQASDGTLESGNELIGRILQAYYADKRNVPFEQIGLDPRAKAYFEKGEGLFVRILNYVDELPDCPIRPDGDGKTVEVAASDILLLFSSWYPKPSVTEMITPEHTGAAVEAAQRFQLFLDDVKQRTQGEIDLAGGIEANYLTSMRNDMEMLRRMGRMAMAMDASGNEPDAQPQMGGAILLTFAKAIWPEEALRQEVWGNTEYYLPKLEDDFEPFRQDIATILFATALNVEHHAASLPGPTEERHVYIETTKHLARDIKNAGTINALLSLLSSAESITALSSIRDDALFLERNLRFDCPRAAAGIDFVLGLATQARTPVMEAELREAGKLLVASTAASSTDRMPATMAARPARRSRKAARVLVS